MFWDWYNRFFGNFEDALGEGSFGIRHFIWIGLVILISVVGYLYFKKHKSVEEKVVFILAILMFIVRFVKQTYRAATGIENPWTMAFPFHMCTVLTFVLPIVVVFRLEKLKTAVYVTSIMGGIITLLLGDYFGSQFLNFQSFEGMYVHSLLILIPIFEIAAGHFRLDIKKSWQVVVGMLVFIGWATLANYVFFPQYDPNYMYLMKNELPFGNDNNFFLFYVLIFVLFFSIIYGSAMLTRKVYRKK